MATHKELLRFEQATRNKALMPRVAFADDKVAAAKKTIADLSTSCIDPKIRKEAAQFIVEAEKDARSAFYAGEDNTLEELAGLPAEQQRNGLLVLYGRKLISKADLDVALRIIASAETAKIEALKVHNELLTKLLEKGEPAQTIDAVPQAGQDAA